MRIPNSLAALAFVGAGCINVLNFHFPTYLVGKETATGRPESSMAASHAGWFGADSVQRFVIEVGGEPHDDDGYIAWIALMWAYLGERGACFAGVGAAHIEEVEIFGKTDWYPMLCIGFLTWLKSEEWERWALGYRADFFPNGIVRHNLLWPLFNY